MWAEGEGFKITPRGSVQLVPKRKEFCLEYSGRPWKILMRQCCPQDDENGMVGEIFTCLWMLSSALRCE